MFENQEIDYIYSVKQGMLLLDLARKTIGDHLNIPDCCTSNDWSVEKMQAPCFQNHLGNFVTLKLDDNLRGCIGTLQASEPILHGVKRNAINAAFHDSRFMPLNETEFPHVKIDISILTAPRPLDYKGADSLLEGLCCGIHGVVIKKGTASATFLPQVWEQLPVPEHFLSQLCTKAGLLPNAWQTDSLDVSTYKVQHFSS